MKTTRFFRFSALGFSLVFLGALSSCSQPKAQTMDPVSAQTGTVKTCKWTMGEENCGKCYSLETEEHGSEIIDYSSVGDLASFVGKKVEYEGTRDQNQIHSTKMCPATLKITKIKAAE